MELTHRKAPAKQEQDSHATTMTKPTASSKRRRHSSETEVKETRTLFSYLQRICLDQTSSNTYFYTRIVFVRLLGLVYAFSFLAAYRQTPVLIGYQGLYPAHQFMKRMQERHGIWQSPSIFYFLPSLETSDFSLNAVNGVGTLLGLFLLLTGRCNAIILFMLWILHTSLHNIGQLFYG